MNNKILAFLLHKGYFFLILIAVFGYLWGADSYYNTGDLKKNLAIFSAVLALVYMGLKIWLKDFSLNWALSGNSLHQNSVKLFYAIALSACIFGAFNYYSFNKQKFTQVGDYYDLIYYYLNSKYYEELGYTDIYDALLIADNEADQRFSSVQTYRELEAYSHVTRETAFARQDKIKGRFTEQRWHAFVEDVRFFANQPISSSWDYFFNDHGYNGTPSWTMMGKLFTTWIPIQQAKWFTSVDTLLIVSMFILIILAFNWEAGIFAFLFYTSTLSGQWPVLGWALLRFDWLAALGLAMATYQRKHFALTGGLIAYATLMRVFPAIFFFPFAVAIVVHFWQNRRLSQDQIRFIVGAALVTLTLAGSALVKLGPQAFLDAKAKIGMHAGPDSYSSHRVGLGDAMVFHGEKNREQMNFNGGILGKAEQIRERIPYLRLLGLLSLGFIAFLIIKEKGSPNLYMPLCVMTLFILTTPQINYFNVRLLLIIWHLVAFKHIRSTIGLILLFAIEAYVQQVDMQYVRYYATSSTSIGLTIYFIFIICASLANIYRKSDLLPTTKPAAITSFVCGMTLLFGLLAAPQLYYRYHESGDNHPITAKLSQLTTIKSQGSRWNADSNILMGKDGILVELEMPSNASMLDLSLDNNDDYLLRFLRNKKIIAEQKILSQGIRMNGLAIYETSVPAAAMQQGYDSILIKPVSGDSFYSIGHLTLKKP